MRSNSFKTQKVREIAQKEALELRGFLSCRRQQSMKTSRRKERNYKIDEKYEEENPCQSEVAASTWDRQPCLDRQRWKRIVSSCKKFSVGEQRDERDSLRHEAQRSSDK